MITPEAIRELVSVARQGCKPEKLGPVGFSDHEIIAVNGGLMKQDKEQMPRAYKVLTEDDVLKAVRATKTKPESCVIFAAMDEVMAILDEDEGRRESVVFRPTKTQAMLAVLKLEARNWLEHQDFVRLLRFDLRGTGGADDSLAKFRALDFAEARNRQSDVQQLSGSIKASHLAQVTGASELPEEIMLRIQPFAHVPDERCDVKCFVEIDPFKAVLRLVPCPVHMEDL